MYGPYSSAFKDTSISQASIYSSLQYNSESNGFNAELGGRLNVHSRYGSNYTYTFNPSYNINARARIFASVSSGFKSPGIFQLYDIYSGNKNLQPEKSVNYEVGLQYQTGAISQRLVGFTGE